MLSNAGDKLKSDVLRWTTTHGHTRVGWQEKTLINQLCADTGFHREDRSSAMADSDEWRVCVCVCVRERERERERVKDSAASDNDSF